MRSKTKLLLILLICFHVLTIAAQNPDVEEWESLFNGEDLDGWTIKIRGYELNENFGNTFRVEDGLLKTGYEAYETFDNKFGHIFYEKPYSYYRLVAEYRFVGEQARGGPGWAYKNSGLMLHCPDPATMFRDQDFPLSIEVQLLGGNGSGNRPTANLCTPGTNVVMGDSLVTAHCLSSTSPTFHDDQWVRVEVLVLGSARVEHYINNEEVMHYILPQIGGGAVSPAHPWINVEGKLLDHGYISLQSESHPIEFRKVELLNLEGCMDPEALNYKSYYVKADNGSCRY